MNGIPFAEVIGDPIEQSLSPIIHCFWLKQLGIRAGYRRHPVGRGQLQRYLDERRANPDWRGCNVTMPLKLDALAAADEGSDRALGAGAANLLLPREGKLLAGNTDVCSVEHLVRKLAAAGAPTARITLLGTGGAARAALMALRLLGMPTVCIQARDMPQAYSLAVQFGLKIEPRPFNAPVETEGLINATPLGMTGQMPLDIELAGMPAGGWVMDFVSSPRTTPLLERARERGLQTLSGIDLLIEQAAESFAHFYGVPPPRDRDGELRGRLA